MKTLIATIGLLFAVISPAVGATAPPDEPSVAVHLCWDLDEFHPAKVEGVSPAQCNCDGLQHISLPGVTLGGNPGNNGGLVPDCFLFTILEPAYYTAKPGGPYNLTPTIEPVIVEVRGCDTSDCFWFFGSASCVIETTHQAGFRVSYRVAGPCSETPD